MSTKKGKIRVVKTNTEAEQAAKDEAFLKLPPSERLRIHEELRRRIWRDRYNKLSLEGLKVIKTTIEG